MSRPAARRRPNRSPALGEGFVMMFTLIAVALGGYVMIESAPDFSNYAVLIRSQQFDRNLAQVRQAVASRPSYLTTADNAPADQILVTAEVRQAVEAMVRPDGVTTDSTALSLGTTPVDPFIPSREWGEVFWGASYNFVRNPAFYDPARREARDPTAMRLFYLSEDGNQNTNLVITDRNGAAPQNILSPNPFAPPGTNRFQHVRRSSDGARLVAQTTLISGAAAYYDGVSFGLSGANRTFATELNSAGITAESSSAELPEWSPTAGRVAYRLKRGPSPIPPLNILGYTMVIKSPELSGVPFDPIAINRGSSGTKFPNFGTMGPPVWSPSERFVAFWADDGTGCYILVYDWQRRNWHLPRQDANGGVSNFPADNCTCRTGGTPIAWRPDSDAFVYVDDLDNVVMATGVLGGALSYVHAAPTGAPGPGTDVRQIVWAPPISIPAGAANEVFFYLRETAADVGDIVRRRLGDPIGDVIRLTDTAWAAPLAWEHPLFDISPGGTQVLYTEGPGRQNVRMVGIDGSNDRKVTTLAAAPPQDLLEVGFLQPVADWIYPGAGIQKLTQKNQATFDHQGWREFSTRNSLFPGDTRFGDGYLQVRNPDIQDQFLFDNGEDIFRISLDAPSNTVLGGAGGNEPRILGKMEATWGWRGANYIARESGDVTGGLAADVFKQVVGGVGSGTTVLVTTGSTPAYGPDNSLLALSKAMIVPTTFPPDTSAFPPQDTDIWVVESNGGPAPTPVNLTPDTTDTAESHPDWSPDGRYVYFQRDIQTVSKFLGNHTAGIYRTTRNGGSITQVVGEASVTPAWNDGEYVSALEFYEPSVSPDGTRLAFIGRERLLGLGSLAGSVDTTRVGEIIGEAVYVKDLLFNTSPTCLLRSMDAEIGNAMIGAAKARYTPNKLAGGETTAVPGTYIGDSAYADHGFHRPSWSADGQALYVNRTFPRNRWYPKKDLNRGGNVGPPALRNANYRDFLERSQIIRVLVTHSWNLAGPTGAEGITKLADGSFDPPADVFEVIVQNEADSPGSYEANPLGGGPGPVFDWVDRGIPLGIADRPRRQILNSIASRGAYVFQRILQDVPAAQLAGLAAGSNYVLSGYVRTKGGGNRSHNGQIMCTLLNNQGLMVDLTTPGANVFQIGLADVGGGPWTRFSAGIRFDPSALKSLSGETWGDKPPFTVLLTLFVEEESIQTKATAEFTGIKMEKAFDTRSMAPTVFSPGWVLHSSSLRPDPSKPNHYIFER